MYYTYYLNVHAYEYARALSITSRYLYLVIIVIRWRAIDSNERRKEHAVVVQAGHS